MSPTSSSDRPTRFKLLWKATKNVHFLTAVGLHIAHLFYTHCVISESLNSEQNIGKKCKSTRKDFTQITFTLSYVFGLILVSIFELIKKGRRKVKGETRPETSRIGLQDGRENVNLENTHQDIATQQNETFNNNTINNNNTLNIVNSRTIRHTNSHKFSSHLLSLVCALIDNLLISLIFLIIYTITFNHFLIASLFLPMIHGIAKPMHAPLFLLVYVVMISIGNFLSLPCLLDASRTNASDQNGPSNLLKLNPLVWFGMCGFIRFCFLNGKGSKVSYVFFLFVLSVGSFAHNLKNSKKTEIFEDLFVNLRFFSFYGPTGAAKSVDGALETACLVLKNLPICFLLLNLVIGVACALIKSHFYFTNSLLIIFICVSVHFAFLLLYHLSPTNFMAEKNTIIDSFRSGLYVKTLYDANADIQIIGILAVLAYMPFLYKLVVWLGL